MQIVSLNQQVKCANHLPLVLIAGTNALESYDLTHHVAAHCKLVCSSLGIPFVFKASFDKANRSSVNSYRGPGMQTGLKWLADIKADLQLPIITDVHESYQVDAVAEVADVLQLPAFLSRQTDLVVALARSNKPINIKKAQFLAPSEMQHILAKFHSVGNDNLLLCERGTMFGYNNLVVDMLGLSTMKAMDVPVIFDVTHSLQLPGAGSGAAGGRRSQALLLAKAGVSQAIAGLFLEVHPKPEAAKCDGPSALPLALLESFMEQLVVLDKLVKNQPCLDIE